MGKSNLKNSNSTPAHEHAPKTSICNWNDFRNIYLHILNGSNMHVYLKNF